MCALLLMAALVCQRADGRCPAPTPSPSWPTPVTPVAHWVRTGDQWAWIVGGVQAGNLVSGEGYYRRTGPGQWEATPSELPAAPPVGYIPPAARPMPAGNMLVAHGDEKTQVTSTAPAPRKNYGVDLDAHPMPPGFDTLITGRDGPITQGELRDLLRGTLAAQAQRPRLMICARDEATRKRAMSLLDGPLKDLAADYTITYYRGDEWFLAPEMRYDCQGPFTAMAFRSSMDGTALWACDRPEDLRANMEAAVGVVRKPNPHFDRSRVPNHAADSGNGNWLLPGAVFALAGVLLLIAFRGGSRR